MKTNVPVSIALLLITLFSCSPKTPLKEINSTKSNNDELLLLNPSIKRVECGGYWHQNGASGQYRVVVICGGYEHVRCSLYLQWVQEGSIDKQKESILSSILIGEISGIGYDLSPSFESSNGKTKVIVRGQADFQKEAEIFTIEPISIGKYAIEARNQR